MFNSSLTGMIGVCGTDILSGMLIHGICELMETTISCLGEVGLRNNRRS